MGSRVLVRENFLYNNPLSGVPATRLFEDVETLITTQDLTDGPIDRLTLHRGALLAKSGFDIDRDRQAASDRPSTASENEREAHSASDSESERDRDDTETTGHYLARGYLTATERRNSKTERDALIAEALGELGSLTKDARIVLFTCAIGAIVQGWSQENIVGANVYWPTDLKLSNATVGPDGILNGTFLADEDRLHFGLTNAVTYFAAGCGVWTTDPISAALGRRSAMLFAAFCSFIAPLIASCALDWKTLLGARIIQGFSMGAKGAVIPVLMSETAPQNLRGRILVLWQTSVAFGILLGAITNCLLNNHWQVAIGISATPAVALICMCFVIPEPPRWLIQQEKYKKAAEALCRLKQTPLQAARDLILIKAHFDREPDFYRVLSANERKRRLNRPPTGQRDPAGWLGFFVRFKELFTKKRNGRAVIASCVVMAAQQFSGINVFAFLATTVVAPQDPRFSLEVKIGFAVVNFAFSAAAFWILRKTGRRALLLTSLTLLLPFLGAMGRLLANDASPGGLVTVLLIYTMIYSPGAGAVPFMYSSEVFGQRHRQVGMSFAVAINFLLAGVLTLCVSIFFVPGTTHNMLLMGTFMALDFVAIVLVWLFMRTEGEKMSLENMHDLFKIKSKDYILYQLREASPKTLARLFTFGHSEYGNKMETLEDWLENRFKNPAAAQGEAGIEMGLSENREQATRASV